MGITKDVSVGMGADLSDLVSRVRLACKRDDAGNVTAAQFLRLADSLYMVTAVAASRGAVNGETVLTMVRLAGEDGPPVAMLSSSGWACRQTSVPIRPACLRRPLPHWPPARRCDRR